MASSMHSTWPQCSRRFPRGPDPARTSNFDRIVPDSGSFRSKFARGAGTGAYSGAMLAPGTPRDFFPTTHRTWLHTQLAAIGEGADPSPNPDRDAALRLVRAHLFERYTPPLIAYTRASSLRRLGEPEEIVHGYLAKTLEDCAPLQTWASSSRPLRRWLLTGLLFHARGLARDAGRARERSAPDALSGALAPEASAEAQFERAWCREVLESAYTSTAALLRDAGRERQWDVFRRHLIEGAPYAAIGAELGMSLQQCADATRAVSGLLKTELVRVLTEDGVAPDEQPVEEILRGVIDGPAD